MGMATTAAGGWGLGKTIQSGQQRKEDEHNARSQDPYAREGGGISGMSPGDWAAQNALGQPQQQQYQSPEPAPPAQQMTPGGPIVTPGGWDFSTPGVAEQFFNHNQQGWMQPGQAAGQWGQAQGQMNAPGAMEDYYAKMQNSQALLGQTASQGALDAFQAQPTFGSYYDNARERQGASTNDALAARGMFNSSAGLDILGQGQTDLNAQQANREGDFALQQAGLGGQLAGQADQARMAQLGMGGQLAGASQSAMMGRNELGMSMASGVDQLYQNQLMNGMQAAGMGQDARRTRGQDYFNNLSGTAGNLAGTIDQNNQGMFSADEDMFLGAMATKLGMSREELNQGYMNAKETGDQAGFFAKLLSSITDK